MAFDAKNLFLLWHTMTSVLSTCRLIQETATVVSPIQKPHCSLFLSSMKVISRKRKLTVSVFLLTLPGIFNPIEQVKCTLKKSLSAH